MNGPGNTTQTEGRARGALIASFLRVVLAASAVVGTGALPSCLLGGPFAPDDAEFRPLRPPVILETPGTTDPLPNRFVELPPSESATFRVCAAHSSREMLFARIFLDRAQVCTGADNCGSTLYRQIDLPFVDAGTCRVLEIPVSLVGWTGSAANRRCIPMDVYVSPEFRSFDPPLQHLPARAGNVAHARWYLVRSEIDGMPSGVPPIDECCANYGEDPRTVEDCVR